MAYGINRYPAARWLKAQALMREWHTLTSFDGYEDGVIAYAKFKMELRDLPVSAHDRYVAMRPVLAEVNYLLDGIDTVNSFRAYDSASAGGMLPSQLKAAANDRMLLKALILGDEPVESIANYMCLRPEAVQFFEYLAWDVRDKLKSEGWFNTHVLGQAAFIGCEPNDYERMMFLTVYRHGMETFHAIMSRLGASDPQRALELIHQAYNSDINTRAFVSGMVMSPNRFNAQEIATCVNILNNNQRSLDLREKESLGGGGGPVGDFAQHTTNLIATTLTGGSEVGLSIADAHVRSGKDKAELPNEEYSGFSDFNSALEVVLREVEVG